MLLSDRILAQAQYVGQLLGGQLGDAGRIPR
jgi:hypothetical protein